MFYNKTFLIDLIVSKSYLIGLRFRIGKNYIILIIVWVLLSSTIINGNFVIMSKKMSIFGTSAKPPHPPRFKNFSHIFFIQKKVL